MSSTTGTLFKVTTFGESHGASVGAVVDGCPARMELSEQDIQRQLDRRRPGQSRVTTPRSEADKVRIVSGVENGVTLGSPIGLIVDNRDTRPGDYRSMSNVPRPSHADFTTRAKYGIVASSGGGRASARETVGRVAAGAVAEKFLSARLGVEIVAWVHSVGDVEAPDLLEEPLTRDDVDRFVVRCPHEPTAKRMIEVIEAAADAADSVGGTVMCVCRNVPPGWGEPVFHKAEARLAAAVMSIPATKGFEVGSGFAGSRMRGSQHNDVFVAGDTAQTLPDGSTISIRPATNRSGGIQGGITNGAPIVMRVAFKPPATIGMAQDTVDYEGGSVALEPKGRHDPCVVPRAVSVVESMVALVLADLALLAASD